MSDIFIVGVGMTPFSKFENKSVKDIVQEAVLLALKDAECSQSQIEAAYFATTTQGPLQGQHTIPGQIALRSMGFERIPVVNVENACASGTSAFHLAIQAIKAGDADITLAVGAEKMLIEDKAKLVGVFDAGWDVETADANKEALLALGEGIKVPPGTTMEGPYSVFMDVYAAFCRAHMRNFGTTQRQIAAICSKNHTHSQFNPLARFQNPLTTDEVMAAPPITYPLTLPMCAPNADGGAAVIVCNQAGLKKLNANTSRAIRVLGTVIGTGVARAPDDYANNIGRLAALDLYEKTSLGPDDIDVAEVHDATAMGEVLQIANLGFAEHQDVGRLAEGGDFSLGGRIPLNPSGGLESKGHAISATGIAQLHELVTQLRGEAGKRQVEGAKIALQENGGGLYGIEEAVVALTALGK